MLSAKLRGKEGIHTTWEAVQKKDLPWVCGVCEEPVTLISPEEGREVLFTPAERFARQNKLSFVHKGRSNHAVRPVNNPFRNDAFGIIYGLLKNSGYAVITDQPINGSGDFAASDISAYDSTDGKRTEIFIEPKKFNGRDLEATVRVLSADGIATMVVLSAWDSVFNQKGQYLRPGRVFEEDNRRHRKYFLVRGNEQKIVEWYRGIMSYVRHSTRSQLFQVMFGLATAPLIPTELTDSELRQIVMRTHANLVDASDDEIVTVKQPYDENRRVKRNGVWNWEKRTGVNEVDVVLGKGKILRVFKDYRSIAEEMQVTELRLMYRTTSEGYQIAFPTPARHLEAKREVAAPLQLGLIP